MRFPLNHFLRFMTQTLCFAMVFGFATSAFALFWDGESVCSNKPTQSSFSWINQSEMISVIEETAPCEKSVDEGSASVCFQDAGAPMSTLPATIAEMQSERTSSHVTRMAEAMVRRSPSAFLTRPEEPRVQLPRYLTNQAPRSECSQFEVECESAPSPLALITVEMNPPVSTSESPRVEFEAPVHELRQGALGIRHGTPPLMRSLDVLTPPPDLA